MLISSILVLATACSSGGAWVKPGASDDVRLTDKRECHELTRLRVNTRESLARESFHGRAIDAAQTNRNDDLSSVRRMMEADRGRLKRRAVSDCMASRGYHRAQ